MIYGIVPVFAFANAGVAFTGLSWDAFPAQIALGIATGLLVGKTIGVLGGSLVSAVLGCSLLKRCLRTSRPI